MQDEVHSVCLPLLSWAGKVKGMELEPVEKRGEGVGGKGREDALNSY